MKFEKTYLKVFLLVFKYILKKYLYICILNKLFKSIHYNADNNMILQMKVFTRITWFFFLCFQSIFPEYVLLFSLYILRHTIKYIE